MSSIFPNAPAIPRDAASLVLMRGTGDETEVLMGRRPDTARFMPGVFVYPGGAVDPGDIALAASIGARDTKLGALALCAIRETWEETGVILGTGGKAPTLDPSAGYDDVTAFLKACLDAGLRPSPQRLMFLAHAITPETEPIRFDTRFFLCHGNELTGSPKATGELPEVLWVRCEAALAARNVSGITKRVLREALRLWSKPIERENPDRAVAHISYHESGYRISRNDRGRDLDGIWPGFETVAS